MEFGLSKFMDRAVYVAAHRSIRPGLLMAGLTAALGVVLASPAVAQEEDARTHGARAYSQLCAYCHDGGLVGPELKGRNLPPEFFMAVARSGLNAMPAFRHTFIDDESLRAVGEYLSTSSLDAESDNAGSAEDSTGSSPKPQTQGATRAQSSDRSAKQSN